MSQALRTKNDAAFAPGQVLRVYGMRRSGNHAIINWIMRNAPGGNGIFLNDCRVGGDPVSSSQGVSVFENAAEADIGGLRRKLRRAGEAPFAVISYEDRMPPDAPKPLYAAPETLVVIYRSFLHWSASLLRKIQGNEGYGPLDRARIMGRAVCTYGDMLARIDADDIVPLCYDDWTQDAAYRKAALGRLGLPGEDLGLGAVQRYGGGSSFQGKTAEASDLATTQRAAAMADDHEYQMLLWTAARDDTFMARLSKAFSADAERLERLRDTATAKVTLP